MSSSEKKSPDLKADRQDESKCFSKERLAELLPDVAHAILGKPNRQLSSGKELRYNTRGSLSIDVPKGTWFDHETKRGGGTLDFIEHHTGCDRAGAFDWLRRNGFDGDQSVNGSGRGRSKLGRIVAEFDYCGPNGELRFQVTKHDPKDFRQRRPDGKGGWIWDLDGVRPVPYRLPELIKAVANERVVAVPEGEKDCNKLWHIGIAATTNAGGAGNWKAELNEHFRGADVVIIPDNDDAGRKHASVVAAQLKSIAKRIRILELWRHWPGMPVKGDVSDWLEKGGGTREKLDALIDAAPVFVAEASADEVPVTPIDLWGHLNPPELPRGLLPVKVEQFAVEQGGVMGVDPGGLAAAALVVCAAAIPDSIELQVKKHERGWTESARLWAALVGMPSTKKTPTMREAVRPLTKLDAAYARDYAAAKQVYDALPPDQRKSATKPVRKQLKLEDTSIEAAQEVLRDNPSGALCLADELSGWFGSMDKYNSGGRGAAKDRGFWLQSWNGGSHSVNRINRGSFLIENLSVSVLGGIQPDLIRKTVDEAHDDGLIQRLLPIVVRPGAAGRDEPTHEVVASYARLIGNLHELEPKFAAGWDNVGGQATKLELDDDAQAIRRELEQKHLERAGGNQ